jgi:hypothetical protein
LVVSNGSNENLEFFTGSTTLNGGGFEYINRTTDSTRPDMNYFLGTVGSHKFYTAGAERLRIASGGNVGIGNTDPQTKLHVNGIIRTQGTTGASSPELSLLSAGFWTWKIRGDGNNLRFMADDTTRMILDSDGNVTNSTGSYGTISDIRVKKNIVNARDYTNDLMKLRVVKYSLKEEKGTTPTKLGFIAQEVEKVFPNMVSTEQNGEFKDFKSIKTSVLIPMLVKTIQRLNARITALEKGEPAPIEPTEPEEPVVETTPEPEFEPITNFEYDENE